MKVNGRGLGTSHKPFRSSVPVFPRTASTTTAPVRSLPPMTSRYASSPPVSSRGVRAPLMSSALTAFVLGSSVLAGFHLLDASGGASFAPAVSSSAPSSIVEVSRARPLPATDIRARLAQAPRDLAQDSTPPSSMVADALAILRPADGETTLGVDSTAQAAPERSIPRVARKRARLPQRIRVTGYSARKGARLGATTLVATAVPKPSASKPPIIAPRFVRPAKSLVARAKAEGGLAEHATRFAAGPEAARSRYSGLGPRVFATLPSTVPMPRITIRGASGSGTMLRAFAPGLKDVGDVRFDALLGRPSTREVEAPVGPPATDR